MRNTDATFKLKSFGYLREFGQLYNARDSNFQNGIIFKDEPPKSLFLTQHIRSESSKTVLVESLASKRELTSMDSASSVSYAAGIYKVQFKKELKLSNVLINLIF